MPETFNAIFTRRVRDVVEKMKEYDVSHAERLKSMFERIVNSGDLNDALQHLPLERGADQMNFDQDKKLLFHLMYHPLVPGE